MVQRSTWNPKTTSVPRGKSSSKWCQLLPTPCGSLPGCPSRRQVLLMSATMDIQSLGQLFPKTPPVLKIPGHLGMSETGGNVVLRKGGTSNPSKPVAKMHLPGSHQGSIGGTQCHLTSSFCLTRPTLLMKKPSNTVNDPGFPGKGCRWEIYIYIYRSPMVTM